MKHDLSHLQFTGEPPTGDFDTVDYVRNPAHFETICKQTRELATNLGGRRLVVLIDPNGMNIVSKWADITPDIDSPHYRGAR